MTTASPSTQEYQILTASIPTDLFPLFFRNKLHPLLPYSLPLYRRCQFYLHDLSLTADSEPTPEQPGKPELWVAVAFPAQSHPSDPQNWLEQWLNSPQPTANQNSASTSSTNTNMSIPTTTTTTISNDNISEQTWLATHIDLREPGQTQIWAFGSWEAKLSPAIMVYSPADSPTTTTTSSPVTTKITPTLPQVNLARALFQRLRIHHIPTLPETPSQQYLTMKAAGKVVSSPYKRSKIIFGTIAEASWWMLEDDVVSSTSKKTEALSPIQQWEQRQQQQQRSALITVTNIPSRSTNRAITRQDKPYLKYILNCPLPPPPITSSQSFTSAPLQTQHLQTVLDRSAIPRTLELLRSLVTIGLFPQTPTPTSTSTIKPDPDSDPNPVSWGILSKDASIGSLHTEPEFRGQGLAEMVVRELIRVEETLFGGVKGEERMVPYGHTDVSVGNAASRRVFEKLGARVGWRVGWVEVDVEFEEGVKCED